MPVTENPRPTVVICHGSYHSALPYEPFMRELRDVGIDAICPQLPSSDLRQMNLGEPPNFDTAPPPEGFPQPSDDAVVVNQVLHTLINTEAKDVVLLGHSSGGFVATYCARPELMASNRRTKALSGGIVGIFLCSGFIIPVGESIKSFFQPKDGAVRQPEWSRFHKYGLDGLLSTVNAARYFFTQLPPEKAKFYESTMSASAPATTIMDNDPFPHLPVAYLICEEDLAMQKAYQDMMVDMQNARPGVNIKKYYAPCDHSPHLSWTPGLVKDIELFMDETQKAL